MHIIKLELADGVNYVAAQGAACDFTIKRSEAKMFHTISAAEQERARLREKYAEINLRSAHPIGRARIQEVE